MLYGRSCCRCRRFLSLVARRPFCRFVGSFVRKFVSSFVRSFVSSFLRSFVPSFLPSFVRSFVRSSLPSFLPSSVPSSVPSLFVVRCPLFVVHGSLVRGSLVRGSWFVTHCSVLFVRCSLFGAHCSVFGVHCAVAPLHRCVDWSSSFVVVVVVRLLPWCQQPAQHVRGNQALTKLNAYPLRSKLKSLDGLDPPLRRRR